MLPPDLTQPGPSGCLLSIALRPTTAMSTECHAAVILRACAHSLRSNPALPCQPRLVHTHAHAKIFPTPRHAFGTTRAQAATPHCLAHLSPSHLRGHLSSWTCSSLSSLSTRHWGEDIFPCALHCHRHQRLGRRFSLPCIEHQPPPLCALPRYWALAIKCHPLCVFGWAHALLHHVRHGHPWGCHPRIKL
jgi:hypothetical protein